MSSCVSVVHPPTYSPERAYAVRVLLETFLGLAVDVSEGRVAEWHVTCDGSTILLPDGLFAMPEDDWLTAESLPADARLYGDDLFGSAFFMLTRYEELACAERDEHGRFPPEASLAVRAGFVDRPVVNELAEELLRRLRSIAPRLEGKPREARLLPSHDVDFPFADVRQRLAALKSGKLRALLPGDPYDTFDLLMDASEERGVRAAFYFMAAGAPYSLDEPRIRRLLRRIHERGHEIGLHASYDAFANGPATRAEFSELLRACEEEKISQDEWGGRAHFLRWGPASWRIWDEAGLSYDASVGYSGRPGFRAGTCYEYPVFDLVGRQELKLRERPLVVMDNPGLARMGNNSDQVVALLESLRARCDEYRGDFTMLWHNNWLITRERRRLFAFGMGAAW